MSLPSCSLCGEKFETELLREEHRDLWGHQCQSNAETMQVVERYRKGHEPYVEFQSFLGRPGDRSTDSHDSTSGQTHTGTPPTVVKGAGKSE